jgi:hypothetical protein
LPAPRKPVRTVTGIILKKVEGTNPDESRSVRGSAGIANARDADSIAP